MTKQLDSSQASASVPATAITTPSHGFASWALLFFISLSPELALAQPSFSLDTILPTSIQTLPFLQQVVALLAMMIMAMIFMVLGFGVVGSVGDVFQTLSEARRMGEWGTLFKTLGTVIAVIMFGVVMSVLVYTWLSTIVINPTVTIG